MKKVKFIPVFSLVLFLSMMASVFATAAFPKNNPESTYGIDKTVTYIVNIQQTALAYPMNAYYVIVITDDQNRMVAPPQAFHQGRWSYMFTEVGSPIMGVRTASLIYYPPVNGPAPYLVTSSKLEGPFYPNTSYLFMLLPKFPVRADN